MPKVYIDPDGPLPGYYAELTTFGPGSPPDRPTPQPPPDGIWGPTDPRPTHPISGIPGYPPPLGPGAPGTRPPEAPPGANATVIPLPPATPPAPVPPGMPAGSTQMLVWFGPGTKPAMAWIGPYAAQVPAA